MYIVDVTLNDGGKYGEHVDMLRLYKAYARVVQPLHKPHFSAFSNAPVWLAHLLNELPNDGVKVEGGPIVVWVHVGQLCEYKQRPRHSEIREGIKVGNW